MDIYPVLYFQITPFSNLCVRCIHENYPVMLLVLLTTVKNYNHNVQINVWINGNIFFTTTQTQNDQLLQWRNKQLLFGQRWIKTHAKIFKVRKETSIIFAWSIILHKIFISKIRFILLHFCGEIWQWGKVINNINIHFVGYKY